MAITGKIFGQTPSSLLEIREWSIARELDIAAARLLYEEELNREVERENRDRKFWIAMLGGSESSSTSESTFVSGEGIVLPVPGVVPKQRGSSRTDGPQADMRPYDLKPKKAARASRAKSDRSFRD
jgi:hypothetical protein